VASIETSLWLVPRQVCGLYRDKFEACTDTSLWLVPRQVCGLYRDTFVACTEISLLLVRRQVGPCFPISILLTVSLLQIIGLYSLHSALVVAD
jgi:hypothetical protein